jgi:hypothetical protein
VHHKGNVHSNVHSNVHKQVHRWHEGVDLKCHSKELLGAIQAQEWVKVECRVV